MKVKLTLLSLLIMSNLFGQYPIGLTGEKHTDPIYSSPGPRTIILLKRVSKVDCTRVKKDTIKHIIRPANAKSNQRKK